MTTWPDTDSLLERFRAWLGEVRQASETEALDSAPVQADGIADGVGLVDVVREFTALRHEVKLQTKSARGLEEQTAAAIASLEEAGRQFRAVEPREAEAARRAALPLIESLADLDESLARTQAVVDTARRRLARDASGGLGRRLADLYAAQPAWKRWLCRSWHASLQDLGRADAQDRDRVVNSLAEGFAMVGKRLERAMGKEGLYRLPSVGLPVDPHAMTVVEVVESTDHPPGTVVEEIRPGYRWNDKVVRFAEVRAARSVNLSQQSLMEQE